MRVRQNAKTLNREFAWYQQFLQKRFEQYFQEKSTTTEIAFPQPPDLDDDQSPYAAFIRELTDKVVKHGQAVGVTVNAREAGQVTLYYRLAILTALAPHLKPEVLDIFYTRNTLFDRGFTEFGGLKGKQHAGFLPTGETALFVMAGADLDTRLMLMDMFDEKGWLYRLNVLELSATTQPEPSLSGALTISEEFLVRFTSGADYHPSYTGSFPAKQLTTLLDWNDLVLDSFTKEEVNEIIAWTEHSDAMMTEWKLNRILKPGYRALFYGPPGTGKTFTATLIGKRTGRPVFRIDLSQLVSKYIGETEKNLAGIFDRAEHRDWILFFDEADALFGKRTATQDAHDRYANQETAYLLQRIEDFNGLIILATNLKGNIDQAFSRRFQSSIYFPVPGPAQRLRLWENSFPKAIPLEDQIDFSELADRYEITGGEITNVVRYASLSALKQGKDVIARQDILSGIKREFRKQGKSIH